MKCPNCGKDLFLEEEPIGNWDRSVDRKAANWNIMTAVMAYQRAGLPLWSLLRQVAYTWDNTHEEMTKMMRERA